MVFKRPPQGFGPQAEPAPQAQRPTEAGGGGWYSEPAPVPVAGALDQATANPQQGAPMAAEPPPVADQWAAGVPAAPLAGSPPMADQWAAAVPAAPLAAPPPVGQPVAPQGFLHEAPVAPPPDALVRKAAHGDPLMRRLGGGLLRAVGAAAATTAQEQAEVGARLARPVSVCRQIAVVSIRGGAGKTTLAALIAGVIAEHRQDRVLALDADPAMGSLPLRLGAQPQHSIHQMAAAQPRTWEETAGFLAQTGPRLWVLPGTTGDLLAGELDPDVLWSAFGPVSRFFSTSVIDCGAGIFGPVQRSVLRTAHAQVLVTPGTVDGALSAKSALDWYAANGLGGLLSRTVVALVSHTPHADADLDRTRAMLSGGGLPVHHMPYDRHLAAGTAIEPARIGAATRSAATRIAAEVFGRSTGGEG